MDTANALASQLDGLVHLDTQRASTGIDLTVDAVFRTTGPGQLDFGGGEFRAVPRERIGPTLDEPDDDEQRQVDDDEQAVRIVLQRARKMADESDGVEGIPREGLVLGCSTEIPKTTAENAIDKLLERGELYETGDGRLLPT